MADQPPVNIMCAIKGASILHRDPRHGATGRSERSAVGRVGIVPATSATKDAA